MIKWTLRPDVVRYDLFTPVWIGQSWAPLLTSHHWWKAGKLRSSILKEIACDSEALADNITSIRCARLGWSSYNAHILSLLNSHSQLTELCLNGICSRKYCWSVLINWEYQQSNWRFHRPIQFIGYLLYNWVLRSYAQYFRASIQWLYSLSSEVTSWLIIHPLHCYLAII